MGRSFASRAGHNARISAAYDRAAAADRLQRALEDVGWIVTRDVASTEVAVKIERHDGKGGWYGGRFAGPTAFDALQLAVSWALGEGSEGGEP